MECDDDVDKLASFLFKINELTSCNAYCEPTVNPRKENKISTSRFSCSENELTYLKNCIHENKNCYSLLNLIESSINLLLENCIKEQRVVSANVDEHKRKQPKNFSNIVGERKIRNLLRVPYFKDASGFSHSHNEDVIKRNDQGFLHCYGVVVPVSWKEQEKYVVAQCIRKVEEEKWTETLKSCRMLHMANVKQMSLKDLVELRYDEYDWSQISVSSLGNSHSPEECRAFWFTCLHPQINQQMWTKDENEKLRILVKKRKCQGWEGISEELGTKRSALQCIKHFKMQLCRENKSQWTESEIVLLKRYIHMFCYKRFIPWCKVRMFMNGRSWKDICGIWNKINDEGKPRTFSLEEDVVLIAGIKLFGNNYPRIQDYLPDRTPRQVRRRIEVLKGRQFPKQVWSTQEDELLQNLVDKYGFGNWLKISVHFVNRSPSAVRWRYIALQKHEDKKSCGTIALKTPMRNTDIVNITSLWEFAEKICQENDICNGLHTYESNRSINIAYELSRILKPRMRSQKAISENKLRQCSDREYSKLLKCAYLPNESKRKSLRNRQINHSLAYDVIIALKLLEAKVNFSSIEEIEKDTVISAHDKYVVKYLANDLLPNCGICSDIVIPNPQTTCNTIASEDCETICEKTCFFFPPNFSTLTAMHSLTLNEENVNEQKQGLTMQLDNVELKEMNTSFATKSVGCAENYDAASKLWTERIFNLLGLVSVILNKEC